MRIVIDMQGAQTASRFRGIGRYTMSFTRAVVRNRGEHEIILALNGMFPETIEPIRAAFDGLLQHHHIRVWTAPGPVRAINPDNDVRHNVAKFMREAFLVGLHPDIIHISSLFEGYDDDAVTGIRITDSFIPVSVTLYDLIPLLNPDHYLKPIPHYAQHYYSKLNDLKKASVCLAISESSRQEGLAYLKAADSRVVNVSTAHDSHFQPCHLTDDLAGQLRLKFGLTRPFILYTGGFEERKNVPRLIQAFANLPEKLRTGHQLLLAGKMPPGYRDHLEKIINSAGIKQDELLFTDYIADEELVQLYNLCKLFVFPSWHEGFGLTVLEAMACGAPVICSNNSSIPEVIGLDSAMFNPFEVGEITARIVKALEDETFRKLLQQHGLHRAKLFSWDESARWAIAAWERIGHAGSGVVQKSGQSWKNTEATLNNLYTRQISDIAALVGKSKPVSETVLTGVAVCLEQNERQVYNFLRATELPMHITWRIEGPFDSSYSLALVNRETARALAELGHKVVLHSTEGPGDFPASEQFLKENPDVAAMHRRDTDVPQEEAEVTSRNLYPPRVQDMTCRLNVLHGYAWEESGFPYEWVEQFNTFLQGIAVTSKHVRKLLIDNGVRVPIAVIGNGVDHWERIESDKQFSLNARTFRFLHVSSCFPRKGADVMLQAYGRAFRAIDDVTLVIKTLPNPHNNIHDMLQTLRAGDADFPDVQILEDDFSDAQMKALYGRCQALVAPSRAEGFGLPMAEAILSGLAVITTAWSGQMDFCTPKTSWLIDYSFKYAKTHLGLFSSVWAEPDVTSLAHVMREVYETPESMRRVRITAGRELLLGKFRWVHTAAAMVGAARSWAHMTEPAEPRIGWVSTWNTRCGIATYSEHLIRNLPCPVTILAARALSVTSDDSANVERCWMPGDRDTLVDLRQAIEQNRLDTLVIQFNYGFFDLPALAAFLNEQVDAGRNVIMVMHATRETAPGTRKKLSILVTALSRCRRILVHATGDLNRLKDHGLIENVMLFPHGILDYTPPVQKTSEGHKNFIVSSYGFFLPHKGLLELIDAVALLCSRGMNIHLRMVNAEYSVPESRRMIKQARKKIASHGLSDKVILCTDFLSDEESLKMLAESDLIVFPYQDTGESASGAVRYGIASGRPVAVTPVAIFDDVQAAVHFLPGQSPEQIAEGIADLLQKLVDDDAGMKEQLKSAERWRMAHRYSRLGARLYSVLVALKNNSY